MCQFQDYLLLNTKPCVTSCKVDSLINLLFNQMMHLDIYLQRYSIALGTIE